MSDVARRLVREENGMTMGLTVVMIALIGVMGAGLLVFVQRDLGSVVEVNQGQRAFETADAGVAAAKRQLLVNACPEAYDGVSAVGDQCAESGWAGGENLTFDGKRITVKIRHLQRATNDTQVRNENYAPEKTTADDPREFFAVDAVGRSSNDVAARRVKAIMVSKDRGIPKTYFAGRNIDVNGNVTITGTSIFAEGDIIGMDDDTLEGSEDLVYGNWYKPPWNTETRNSSAPGAGAEGRVCYGNANSCPRNSARYNTLDFDGDSGIEFRAKTWDDGDQPNGVISYPFNKDKVDENLVDFLRNVAKEQGSYYDPAGSDFTIGSNGGDAQYPNNSDDTTVFFVEFTGNSKGDVKYKEDFVPKGTTVVINADVTTNNSSPGYQGIFLIRDPQNNDLLYKNAGNFNLEGYVNIEGDMKIRGTVDPFGSEEVANRPGFHDVDIWSWREVYRLN